MDVSALEGLASLDDVVRHSLDGLFVIDSERRYVVFTEGCERITGYERASILGKRCTCHDVTDCKDMQGRSLAGALCPSMKILRGDVSAARQRMSLRRADLTRVWVETTYAPMYDGAGKVACILGVLRDITDTVQREEELRIMAEGNMPAHKVLPPIATQADVAHCVGSPEGGDPHQSLDEILAKIEKKEILEALRRAEGQRTQAARHLGISRSRLYRRMEALGIDPKNAGVAELT